MTTTVGDDFPNQQRRVREKVLPQYESCRGMPNVNVEPAIYMIKQSLKRAEKAAISGDLIAILEAYEDLKGIE
jgi:hypothetical protein